MSEYPNLSALEEGTGERDNVWGDDVLPYPQQSRYYSEELLYDTSHNETIICWALVWTCVGILVWPCFIVSFLLIRPVKNELSSYNHRYCTVMTIYGIDVAGIVIGTIGTIIAIIELVYTYAK